MKQRFAQIINETIKQYTKAIISEGIETKNMRAAKHYLYDNAHMTEEQAMRTIGAIKTDIPNSRLSKCKYMLALVRMFINMELDTQTTIMQLNKSLKYAASEAHEKEYDQNLNGLSAEEVINKFKSFAQKETEQDKDKLKQQQYNEEQSNYDIIKIRSFGEASQYGEYTTWCVTNDQSMWNSYTAGGERAFYFCLRKDFQSVEKEKTENCPLDDYGLSMIAVSVNPDGSPNTITCRWNHENKANDTIMTTEELSNVINRNYYNTFLPNTPEEIEMARKQMLEDIQEEINKILSEYEIYDKGSGFQGVNGRQCGEERDEYDNIIYLYDTYVYYSDTYEKCCLTNEDGEMIGDELYDWILTSPVHDKWNGKWALFAQKNDYEFLINLEGKPLTNEPYRAMFAMKNVPLVRVTRDDGLVNVMDIDGKVLLKDWYYEILLEPFNRWAVVTLFDNGLKNVISLKTGKPLFDKPIETMKMTDFGRNAVNYKLIQFKGEPFHKIYDTDGNLAAPWEIEYIGIQHNVFLEDKQHESYRMTGQSMRLLGGDLYVLDQSLDLYEVVDEKYEFGFDTIYIVRLFKENPM